MNVINHNYWNNYETVENVTGIILQIFSLPQLVLDFFSFSLLFDMIVNITMCMVDCQRRKREMVSGKHKKKLCSCVYHFYRGYTGLIFTICVMPSTSQWTKRETLKPALTLFSYVWMFMLNTLTQCFSVFGNMTPKCLWMLLR